MSREGGRCELTRRRSRRFSSSSPRMCTALAINSATEERMAISRSRSVTSWVPLSAERMPTTRESYMMGTQRKDNALRSRCRRAPVRSRKRRSFPRFGTASGRPVWATFPVMPSPIR